MLKYFPETDRHHRQKGLTHMKNPSLLYLLLLPFVVWFLVLWALEERDISRQRDQRRRAEIERLEAAQRSRTEKRRAAEAAEADALWEKERAAYAKIAAKEAKTITHKRPCNIPAPQPSPAPDPVAALMADGNRAFRGQVVAFTGTIPGMTRAECIAAVERNGGKAYATMPAGTTMLVVGNNPGSGKLDKADQHIGQIRKISVMEFRAYLQTPLILTPAEFASNIQYMSGATIAPHE